MVSRSRQLQLELESPPRWGGTRPCAGRKPGPSRHDPHRRRAPLASRHPCHLTLKVKKEVPPLRTAKLVAELERSWREACDRRRFRLVHYSIQSDHVHMIVEAGSARDLACGLETIAVRSPERDRLRATERAPPHREADRAPARDHASGPGVVGAVVLGLAKRRPAGPRSTRCRSAPHLASQRRLAQAWTHRHQRDSRLARSGSEMIKLLTLIRHFGPRWVAGGGGRRRSKAEPYRPGPVPWAPQE